jgi:hypothetical protein
MQAETGLRIEVRSAGSREAVSASGQKVQAAVFLFIDFPVEGDDYF